MASAVFHAVAALSLGCVFRSRKPVLSGKPAYKYWAAGIFCAVVPDADSIGFAFGVRYGDLLGHRGLSHSLLFAVLLGLMATFTVFRAEAKAGKWEWPRLAAYLILATASHGLLDALTNGGLGVAFFSPFDTARYFFPFHPIEVSPINVARFLQGRGLDVLASECKWIGLPALALSLCAEAARRLPAFASRGGA
jgi:inner membrane protein